MRGSSCRHKLVAILTIWIVVWVNGEAAPSQEKPLTIQEVLASVMAQYPPFLAALIEQDIANGRIQQASGAFDTTFQMYGQDRPDGYYDGTTGGVMLEKPFQAWGGSVYGGYRLSSGFLPNYDKQRTPDDGQLQFGIKIPLLRDGTIDSRRVRLKQAELDAQMADPLILRQRLDFIRAASIAYYHWCAMGHRVLYTENLLKVAEARDAAIAQMIEQGATAPIVRVDNRRLVVSRKMAMVNAVRRFEAAAIELSLFFRDRDRSEPIRVGRSRLPVHYPDAKGVPSSLREDLARAMMVRPELRRFQLMSDKVKLEEKLAENHLLPDVSFGLQANQSPNGSRSKDIEETEIEAKLELRVPLERNEAKGRLAVSRSQLERLAIEERFTKERIAAEVRDSYSALEAAVKQLSEAQVNVELADQLSEAEAEKFRLGDVDLFALQIREQAAFEARLQQIEAKAEYFRSLANYRAAVAADAPSGGRSRGSSSK